MTRDCDYCGKSYSRTPDSKVGRFCSTACSRVGRKRPDRKYRRIRNDKSHPLAGKNGLVAEARAVLYDKIGPGPHRCHWCGREIVWTKGKRGNVVDGVIADHVNSDEFNDDPENLVPACGTCNGSRAKAVADDEPFNVRPGGTRLRGEARVCASCGGGFVAWPDPRPNKGLYCSRSCARRGAPYGRVTVSE